MSTDMISFDQALDISYGTLQRIRRKKPPLTYAYTTYATWNVWWKSGMQETGGDKLEGHITLGSEDNARHSGFWAQDSTQKKNINERYRLSWKHADNSMAWNFIEMDINRAPERIYNVWEQQYNACMRDLIDDMFRVMFTGPTSSTDQDNPYSVFSWMSLGTEGSTGGFTGYSGRYNDGSTPGTTFNKGGIASSATVNPLWASYYADHDGNLDDSLLLILDEATRKLNFQAPQSPKGLPMDTCKFALYTNNNVIKNLKQFKANSDDNMGFRDDVYYGSNAATFNRIPMVYTPPLDEANVSVYGTDPILGLNHDLLYPCILKNWNFKIAKRPDCNRHNVMTLWMDTVYQIWCENPRHAGFLVSQHPGS